MAVLTTCMLLGLMAAGAGPAGAQVCDLNGPSHPPDDPSDPYYCQVLEDTGEFSLGEWDTSTKRLDCPSYSDGFDTFNAYYTLWTSSSSVTATPFPWGSYISSTYTNWSVTTSHYARTQMLCQAADYDPSYPTNEAGSLLAAPSRHDPTAHVRKDSSHLLSATAPMKVKRYPTARVKIDCPAGTEVLHAEGHVLFREGAPRGSSRIPAVGIQTAATSAVASASSARLGPHRDAELDLTVACGPAKAGDVTGGTAHDDEIAGSNAADRITAGAGVDEVFAGGGDDTISAGADDDVVRAGAGNDSVSGGTGQNVVEGGSGDDTLVGGPERDLIRGGSGHDRLTGAGGNDRIDARDGRSGDTVSCGSGIDTVLADPGDDVAADCERVYRHGRPHARRVEDLRPPQRPSRS
jgi:hypothetical protein